ncbi:protein LEKR1 [Coregonus clupeaformis]|uniref:protein LEKR1 n=1 Tax=Coregonus clupeaformis TaxID=59861 RepID=UPI001E1C95A1|nr:protein LEKR1 [Coregonus clupeaformis]
MGEKESVEREEMDLHIPFYPLPEEIQQMERSETVCQYCGVSYLILHEFQLLQDRLAQVERELQNQRGAAERERAKRELLELGREEWERALREEIQRGATEKENVLREEHEKRFEERRCLDEELEKRSEERDRALRAQLERGALEREMTQREQLEKRSEERWRVLKEEIEKRSEEGERVLKEKLQQANTRLEEQREDLRQLEERLKSVGLERDMTEGLLGKERELCQQLRGRCVGQQETLTATLSLLRCSRQELRDIQGFLSQLTGAWEDCRSQLLERSRKAYSALREELRSVCVELQRIRMEREHVEQKLIAQSRKTEELVNQQTHTQREQRDRLLRLSQELREKEEGWLSCRCRCDSLQSQLLACQQREEEATRKYSGAEQDVDALRRKLEHAQQKSKDLSRDSERMMEDHRKALTKMEDDYRQELPFKLQAALEEQRTQNAVRLKEQEEELKREAGLELVIDREKSQELLLQYQREKEQLQRKLFSQDHSATQELREEVQRLEVRLREVQEERSAKEERLQRALQHSQQQGALDLSQARTELQLLRRENAGLQDEVVLLQETVRRECEERGELTAALTHVREQLLVLQRQASPLDLSHLQGKHPQTDLPHSQTKVRLPLTRSLTPQHTLRPSSPYTATGGREGGAVGRSVASWHGSGGGAGERERGGSLPKLRSSSEVKHRVNLVMGRKERS